MTHTVGTGLGVRWVRLEHSHYDPDVPYIDLMPEEGYNAYNITNLDLGHPEERDVRRSVPHIDGERDTTRFHGARVISMDLQIVEHDGYGPNIWREKLRHFMHPSLRPILSMHIDGLDEAIRAVVRCSGSTFDFDAGRPSFLKDTILWRVPSGRLESNEEKVLIIRPEVPTGGRTYPLVYPRVYPNIGPISGVHVHNYGNARANAKFRIYGPIMGPMLMNHSIHMSNPMSMTAGAAAYVFKEDFEIMAGSYVEINPDMRTITMNGMLEDSVLDQLDYEHSVWWSIEPIHNDIMLSSMMHQPPAQAHILWRNTYL